MATSADVHLEHNRVKLLGDTISLEASLLIAHASSLWLNNEKLFVSWDLQKAQEEFPDPHKPYAQGHVVAFEATLEASDLVLVEFVLVDPEPVVIPGRDGGKGGDLTAPLDEGDPAGGGRSGGATSSSKGAETQPGATGKGKYEDHDPPPRIIRQTKSLLKTLADLQQKNYELLERLSALEERVEQLTIP